MLAPGPWFDSLIEYHRPDIATWKGRAKLIERMAGQDFDLFVNLSNVIAPVSQVFRDMLFARLVGCRFSAGFVPGDIRFFHRAQALHLPRRRESQRLYDSISKPLNLPPPGSTSLPYSREDQALVTQELQNLGILRGSAFVVMHVGAKRQTNRWFPDRFSAVADRLQEGYRLPVLLTGSGADRELIAETVRQMRTAPAVLARELTLPQLAAVMDHAVLYVGNDTGPMHIAAAMGTPTVSIFSARDLPERWYPNGDSHFVIREDVPCSPCFKEICDRGLVCLDRVTVDSVLRGVDFQLANPAQARKHA